MKIAYKYYIYKILKFILNRPSFFKQDSKTSFLHRAQNEELYHFSRLKSMVMVNGRSSFIITCGLSSSSSSASSSKDDYGRLCLVSRQPILTTSCSWKTFLASVAVKSWWWADCCRLAASFFSLRLLIFCSCCACACFLFRCARRIYSRSSSKPFCSRLRSYSLYSACSESNSIKFSAELQSFASWLRRRLSGTPFWPSLISLMISSWSLPWACIVSSFAISLYSSMASSMYWSALWASFFRLRYKMLRAVLIYCGVMPCTLLRLCGCIAVTRFFNKKALYSSAPCFACWF